MQDTQNLIMVSLKHPFTDQLIRISLTEDVREIIESDGFEAFEAIQRTLTLSEQGFSKLEKLSSPQHS